MDDSVKLVYTHDGYPLNLLFKMVKLFNFIHSIVQESSVLVLSLACFCLYFGGITQS